MPDWLTVSLAVASPVLAFGGAWLASLKTARATGEAAGRAAAAVDGLSRAVVDHEGRIRSVEGKVTRHDVRIGVLERSAE